MLGEKVGSRIQSLFFLILAKGLEAQCAEMDRISRHAWFWGPYSTSLTPACAFGTCQANDISVTSCLPGTVNVLEEELVKGRGYTRALFIEY